MAASPVLDDEEVKFFQDNGWIRINQLIPAETASRLHTKLLDMAPDLLRKSEKGQSFDQYFNDVATRQHRLYLDPTRCDEEFRAAAMSQRVVDFAKAVIGTDSVRFLRATVFEKSPASSDNLPTTPHQDYPYLPFDRSGSIQIWIALTDISADMGTLRFASGSHRLFGSLGRVNANDEEQELFRHRTGDLEMTPAVDLRAGDATAHDDLTIHGTDRNMTERSRWGFAMVYLRPDAKYTGAEYYATDGLGLKVGQPPSDELFPVLG